MFGGNAENPGLPSGQDIPLGARILTIADAFDAIGLQSPLPQAQEPAEAFEELRRCAGQVNSIPSWSSG
jgi:response regulator RpfG family c-di-GMP phosphodiesterase